MSKMKKRTMEQELDGCLKLFEFMGLQYFSLSSLTASSLTEKPSIQRRIFLITIFVIVISLVVVYIMNDQVQTIDAMTSKNILMVAVQRSLNVGFVAVICISLTQAYHSTTYIKKIFLNTKQIVQICHQEFNAQIDFERIRKETLFKFSAMLCFLLAIHIVVSYSNKENFIHFILLIMGSIPTIFITTAVFKFVFYVGMINNQLEFIMKLLDETFEHKLVRNFDNINFHLMPVKPMRTPEDPMRKLRTVWRIYHLIYDNGLLVNQSIGITLLAMLVSLVTVLTIAGYQGFVVFIGELPTSKIIDTAYYTLVTNFVLVGITGYCEKTQTNMTKLSMSLKRLECENYEQLRYETREFLQNFYLQLVHHPIMFTAFGFYKLNLGLYAAIITGIVSYQIILIQFYSN